MNILALRGDPPQGTNYDPSNDYFKNAEDLVRYVRVTSI
jgi:5,10-methylenetetrahydrofolate reductase